MRIGNESVFNFLPRITKIFMSSEAVFSDGSFMATSGSEILATSADHFSVPVFVLAPMHYFTPLMPFSQQIDHQIFSPQKVYPSGLGKENLEVSASMLDIVPSSCVTLIVSEAQVYSPDYVYRAFWDYYLQHDYGYNF